MATESQSFLSAFFLWGLCPPTISLNSTLLHHFKKDKHCPQNTRRLNLLLLLIHLPPNLLELFHFFYWTAHLPSLCLHPSPGFYPEVRTHCAHLEVIPTAKGVACGKGCKVKDALRSVCIYLCVHVCPEGVMWSWLPNAPDYKQLAGWWPQPIG